MFLFLSLCPEQSSFLEMWSTHLSIYFLTMASTPDSSHIPRVRYSVRPNTFVSPFADSKRVVVSYWRKYVHEVLVKRLGGLSLPRKKVVRLTDHPDMTMLFTVDVKQQQQKQQQSVSYYPVPFLSLQYSKVSIQFTIPIISKCSTNRMN